MKPFLTVAAVLILSCISARAQDGYWYNLKATQLLSQQDGKEVLVIIRSNQEVIKANFNAKLNSFSVHSSSPLNLSDLIHHLNAADYYVADITKDSFHNDVEPNTGFNYQAALLYCYSVEKFEDSGIVKIALSDIEYDMLSTNQQAIMNTCPYFFHMD